MTEGYSLTDLLTIYLYQNKYLSLPDLGRFEVSDNVDLAHPGENSFSRIPKEAISFSFNPAEGTDTELVKYITSHSRKMKSLAVADLFTLSDQAREVLNVFQPVSFDGIGTLNKNPKGQIEFTPGVYRAELLRNFDAGIFLPDYSESPSSSAFDATTGLKTGRSSRSMGGTLIIVICLIIAAVLIYFMIAHRDTIKKEVQNITHSSNKQPQGASSADSMRGKERISSTSGPGVIHYEVVFERATTERALYRYDQLTGWGHKVIMRTKDSIHYTLAIPFTTPAKDTTKMKDSIRILYGHPTTIRYNSGE